MKELRDLKDLTIHDVQSISDAYTGIAWLNTKEHTVTVESTNEWVRNQRLSE